MTMRIHFVEVSAVGLAVNLFSLNQVRKEKKMKKKLMFIVSMLLVFSVFLSACGAPATPTQAAATDVPAATPKLVGISMPTKTSTRWISDGNSMVKAFEALGYK